MNNKGSVGEKAAEDFLIGSGYDILEKNYRSRFGEIDIIAKNADYILFVEVKARSSVQKALPREAVDRLKRNKLIKTALIYLSENISELQPRFDIIEVIGNHDDMSLNHLENAFDMESYNESY